MSSIEKSALARMTSMLGVASIFLACARRGPGGAPANNSGFPTVTRGDVQQLYARELPPLPKTPFVVGAVSGEVESASPPTTEQDDRSTRLKFSLGTGSPVQCFVYPKAQDPGALLLAIVKAIDKVDVRAVHPTDVVVIGEHAAVLVELQYLAKTASGAAVGEVKLMAYDHPITPLLCMHDEVGYNAAFKRITVGLAASLKVAGQQLRIPTYVGISVERIDGHPTGFSRSTALTGDDGNKMYVETSSSLVPRSAHDLLVEDTHRVEMLDKTGRVTKLLYSKNEGGETSDDLVLKHVSGREYRYEGTHLGKRVAGVLKTKGPKGFPTDGDIRQEMHKLFTQGAKKIELRIEEYHPDLDVSAPVEVVYTALSRGDRTLSARLGSTQMTVTLDDQFLPQKSEMPIGGATLTLDRVFVRGSP